MIKYGLRASDISIEILESVFFDSNNQIVPLLAADMPQISEDGLEYTIPLRPNLQFPDGTDFTADDVVWSLNRAKFGQGGYLVNLFLKDADEDGYGDDDDDDDDDDERNGSARNPAPAGTVTPPQNGLFGNGAPPQVQMN